MAGRKTKTVALWGARILRERMPLDAEYDVTSYRATPAGCPADSAKIARAIIGESMGESFLVMMLDTKNKLVGIQISTGTIDRVIVYPREVIHRALDAGAVGLILAHNHPSGDPCPSGADKDLTKLLTLAAAGVDIAVHDHIILGEGDKFYSFRENGVLT